MEIKLSQEEQFVALNAVIEKLNKQVDYLCWHLEHRARDGEDDWYDRPLCPKGIQTVCKADTCSECWKKYSEEYAVKKMRK